MHSIETSIESSRWILDLQDDWDEQGATAYSRETWQRAVDFLRLQARYAKQSLNQDLPAPGILPGPHGSIDLHWKTEEFELLINIPADSAKPGTYYGDDYGVQTFKGSLNPSGAAPGLIFWILYRK